jgi:signal transduction histidine kinase
MTTEDLRSRDALIEIGIALARTIDLDRVLHEVARLVDRALPGDGVVIALADDDTAALRARHAVSVEGTLAEVETRLTPLWLEALANGRAVVQSSGGAAAITAPMASTEGVIGAITVLGITTADERVIGEAARLLTTVAAQTEAAIERAELVRRVEHKRRLEAIGEVAAGVAHELRNPLFGISSAAQLLRFHSSADPTVEKNVGRILREVERLNRMVTALLEYGRPHALQPVRADPDAIWDDIIEGQRARIEAAGVALHRARVTPPATIPVDTEQLSQVFLNILVNALDAAPTGTSITLTSLLLPSGAWRCRLHNAGPPIPPEALHRVFEIFFSTKTGGTGIGLALCQRIVEEHRGTITLESRHDTGTAVTITLPPAS